MRGSIAHILFFKNHETGLHSCVALAKRAAHQLASHDILKCLLYPSSTLHFSPLHMHDQFVFRSSPPPP